MEERLLFGRIGLSYDLHEKKSLVGIQPLVDNGRLLISRMTFPTFVLLHKISFGKREPKFLLGDVYP